MRLWDATGTLYRRNRYLDAQTGRFTQEDPIRATTLNIVNGSGRRFGAAGANRHAGIGPEPAHHRRSLKVATPSYFEVLDDVHHPGRWYVSEPALPAGPVSVRGTDLIRGEVVNAHGTLAATVRIPGEALDFTFADFGVPLVRSEIGAAIDKAAPGEIQRLPLVIEGCAERYEILNVVGTVDCLDEERSRITRWTEQDGLPELVGTYLSVLDPVIDATRTGGRRVFRIEGWVPPVIVGQEIANLLSGATGIVIQPVDVR
jgi:hypothetical protein